MPSGVKATAFDRTDVPAQGADLPARVHVPELDGPVVARRGQDLAVRAERHVADGLGVALERVDFLAGGDVPDAGPSGRPRPRPRGGRPRLIATDRTGAPCPSERADDLAGGRSRSVTVPISRGGGEERAVGAEGDDLGDLALPAAMRASWSLVRIPDPDRVVPARGARCTPSGLKAMSWIAVVWPWMVRTRWPVATSQSAPPGPRSSRRPGPCRRGRRPGPR